jgi:hypothetical protein
VVLRPMIPLRAKEVVGIFTARQKREPRLPPILAYRIS